MSFVLCSFILLFLHSFIHLFIYSFIHLFIYSFIHLFIYSVDSSTHPYIDLQVSTSDEGYEKEKDELKRTMTLKMMRKKDVLTLRLEREQQDETTELVKKHSRQMLDLLQSKQDELKTELRRELDDEIVSFSFIPQNTDKHCEIVSFSLTYKSLFHR